MMSHMKIQRGVFCLAGALAVFLVLVLAVPVKPLRADDKPKPEELIKRYLETLGSPEAVAAIKTRNAQGRGQFVDVTGRTGFTANTAAIPGTGPPPNLPGSQTPGGVPAPAPSVPNPQGQGPDSSTGGIGQIQGPSAFLSDGDKLRFSLRFDYPDFPGVVVAFDGKKHHVPRLTTDTRIGLVEFLHRFNFVIKEGLLGSALSTAWPLLHLEERKPKLKSHGLKKVGDTSLYRLEYKPRKGGGGLKINLYFDPETMRHVLTTYEVENRYGMRTSPNAALESQESVVRLTLEESFAGFRAVDGMEVPTLWRLRFTEFRRESGQPPIHTVTDWAMNFLAFTHNQPMEQAVFVVED